MGPKGFTRCCVFSLWLSAVAVAQVPRSIWLWESEAFRMLDDDAYRTASLDFLTNHDISTVYFYADQYHGRNILVDQPEKYRQLIAQMHGLGQQVYASLGSAPLNTPAYIRPENRQTAETMFGNVLDFNAAAGNTNEQFDGITVDIEPYLLPDWDFNTTTLAKQYLDLSARFMQMKAEAGSDIPVGPAMPFWFDGPLGQVGVTSFQWGGTDQPMYKHVMDIHDFVTVMDYRDFALGPNGMVEHATNELDYAMAMGKPVTIGVETGPIDPEDPNSVTFMQEGPEVLEQELALAETEFKNDWPYPDVFSEFAIHDFLNYQRLLGDGPDGIPEPSSLLMLVGGGVWLVRSCGARRRPR